MHLSRSLTTTVLGAVHTVGDQCNGRGVDGMNRALKAAGQAIVETRRSELRIERLKVSKKVPQSCHCYGACWRARACCGLVAPHHESLQVLRHGGEGYHRHRSAQSHG